MPELERAPAACQRREEVHDRVDDRRREHLRVVVVARGDALVEVAVFAGHAGNLARISSRTGRRRAGARSAILARWPRRPAEKASEPAQASRVLLALILVAGVANLNLVGRQRRAAGHRQALRLVADDARPDRGRLLARPRRLRALPRRARRPLRAQDDAASSAWCSRCRRACSPPSRRRDEVLFAARVLGGLVGRHGLPDHAGAHHRALVGPGRARSRSRCGRRSAARSPSLGPLVAGALLEEF